jgi:putative two-component system response regulator
MDQAPLVLVVDDDPPTRDLLAQIVTDELEARAVQAGDADTARHLARELRPSLILLDMRLPLVSGVDLCRELRADPATAGARIVAVTAIHHADTRAEAEAAGCDDWIDKPFELNEVVERLRRHLELKPG